MAGSGAELAQWMCQVHNVVNRRSVSLGFENSVVTSISIVFLKMCKRWTIMDPRSEFILGFNAIFEVHFSGSFRKLSTGFVPSSKRDEIVGL